LIDLLEKIEVWWIVNVEVPGGPDAAGRGINGSAVIPGPIVGLKILLDVALGDQERSQFYYREFTKRGLIPSKGAEPAQ
jgi:hypothetical protein